MFFRKTVLFFVLGIAILSMLGLFIAQNIGLFAITGAIEGGETVIAGPLEMTLATDTIIEPEETLSGTLFANTFTNLATPPHLWQLYIEKDGIESGTVFGPARVNDRDFEPPTPFTYNVTSEEPGKYVLKAKTWGATTQPSPPPGSTPTVFSFNPQVNLWIVDERCANPQDFVVVNESFLAGQSFNIDSFTYPVETFCYNYYIRKHKPESVLEKSVLEYDFLEKGQTISVPLDEIWEFSYFASRDVVGLPPECTPDTVFDAETGTCTVDITLLQECNGVVDIFNGTCVETGAPNCPIGQLEIIKADGTGVCAFAQQTTVDDEGNTIVCGLASILNPETFLCETPSDLAPLLCEASEINPSTGICERFPRVTCSDSEKVWSQALTECITLPESELNCIGAGFVWNELFSICSVEQLLVSGDLEEDCALIGGSFEDGVCIVREIAPGVSFSIENTIFVVVGGLGLLVVILVILILIFRR